MKEYLKIIDEIIALVGLHLIPKFVNLYQGQVDIRCEENDTGVLINIIVSLPDKNELQALQNQVGMDSLQAKQILEGILKLEKMDSCKPLENRQLELKRIWLNKINDPDGNRTRVTAVKGRCLNRLTTGPLFSSSVAEPFLILSYNFYNCKSFFLILSIFLLKFFTVFYDFLKLIFYSFFENISYVPYSIVLSLIYTAKLPAG